MACRVTMSKDLMQGAIAVNLGIEEQAQKRTRRKPARFRKGESEECDQLLAPAKPGCRKSTGTRRWQAGAQRERTASCEEDFNLLIGWVKEAVVNMGVVDCWSRSRAPTLEAVRTRNALMRGGPAKAIPEAARSLLMTKLDCHQGTHPESHAKHN
ncbi:hypothetical protein NDU88_001864 [Pleurodeles waltl]|uniref:Uncharacterized protein n=1 Tax=Pleurodeles waltl TaxID=8319 RepID=A0AAV7UXX2_PLEWA|nr:hypothetical protein NDU88_001864 [Pleurodeles waltl]